MVSKQAEQERKDAVEIVLKTDEENKVVTKLEEVEEQLNQAFGETLQAEGITVNDWNIFSKNIANRWVPLAGEKYGLTSFKGILEQESGTYQVGVNRYFGKLDFTKINPMVKKEFTITITRKQAYETRELELELGGNGTVKAGTDTLGSGFNEVSQNAVSLQFVPEDGQYVKAVALNGKDITNEIQFKECIGTYQLAAGEDAASLKVEFAEAGFEGERYRRRC